MGLEYLLIIDPQNDFCDPTGSLYVANADSDMRRLANFIDKKSGIDQIFISLDSHHYYQIFNPCFWVDKNGLEPKPFTQITSQDIKNAIFKTANKNHSEWALHYTLELEKKSKYPLIIWPYHCIIGSIGAGVYPDILSATERFEKRKLKSVEMIFKGDHELTEHYSILRSEVAVDNASSTKINETLIKKLATSDMLFIGGEALSHCVANSIKDMLETKIIDPKKITLLIDTTSPVIKTMGDEFLEFAKSSGILLASTQELLKTR